MSRKALIGISFRLRRLLSGAKQKPKNKEEDKDKGIGLGSTLGPEEGSVIDTGVSAERRKDIRKGSQE